MQRKPSAPSFGRRFYQACVSAWKDAAVIRRKLYY